MSDTPKTDELAKRELVPDGVWIRHARELEHENAALREENAVLRRGNERLIKTASEVLEAFVLHKKVETGHPCPENMCLCIDLRAAIDAARAKEAKP